MAILDQIDTIVLLMFENRSFDHMLGHLSLEGINSNVEGLKEPLARYNNNYLGDAYPVFKIATDKKLSSDLPHEYDSVAVQMAKSRVTKRFTMTGFVNAYATFTGVTPNPKADPMGYFGSSKVPITSFLAEEFCACDNWFCSLPTGTQPNRTMAFSGDSPIYKNSIALPIGSSNIFNWMTDLNIRWRVYHDGLSFFALYPSLWKYVFSDNFRRYENLATDIQHESPDKSPQVIIIEPSYQDAPHVGSDRPNDNHPPLAIGWGEEFLRRTYEAITGNADKWKKTVMVVYYDEHGGFYDHVSPPNIGYNKIPEYPFESLGPRIPGIIISPFVNQKVASHELFDHTSVLQLLAEKFTPTLPYSQTVADRKAQHIKSISIALTNPTYWAPPPPPPEPIRVSTVLGASILASPEHENQKAFESAALDMLSKRPDDVRKYYPELLLWKKSVENARG